MPLTILNRTTESDVRTWLNKNGFVGKSAKFNELELHAIQRPGWVQVFKFCARVKCRPLDNEGREAESSDQLGWQEVFGVAFDDERERKRDKKTQVWLFKEPAEQKEKLDQVFESWKSSRLLSIHCYFYLILIKISKIKNIKLIFNKPK